MATIHSFLKHKMLNISWFQLLECEDVLCFFVIYDKKSFGVLDYWLDKRRNLNFWAFFKMLIGKFL